MKSGFCRHAWNQAQSCQMFPGLPSIAFPSQWIFFFTRKGSTIWLLIMTHFVNKHVKSYKALHYTFLSRNWCLHKAFSLFWSKNKEDWHILMTASVIAVRIQWHSTMKHLQRRRVAFTQQSGSMWRQLLTDVSVMSCLSVVAASRWRILFQTGSKPSRCPAAVQKQTHRSIHLKIVFLISCYHEREI